ncbi:very short patch repair endonuclease [Rhizobium phaseoli]|uniref:very short patch repair endonuclease n=1 Tax=Rhizobium phaseoli TaxID=396 RepID=UPI000BEA8F3C|nr:DNA mismatch endonuclease Vsr [Rhizobium phaseoli]PDS69647.1 very short patch repair endonuclease [Rhizobium phaseoli]
MADKLSPQARSKVMGRVKSKNTGPEVLVRRIVHRLGFRFRLHGKDLPGRPDLVFRRRRKVIFVHGCFWHRHHCGRATTPRTNVEFWERKFSQNIARDNAALEALDVMGWSTLVIWECQTKDETQLARYLDTFLESVSANRNRAEIPLPLIL